jgi:hypothetical protein
MLPDVTTNLLCMRFDVLQTVLLNHTWTSLLTQVRAWPIKHSLRSARACTNDNMVEGAINGACLHVRQNGELSELGSLLADT